MPKTRLLVILGLAAVISSQAMAQLPAKRPAIANQSLSTQDRTLVDQASAYLEALGQAKGRFVQTDPRGSQLRGDLYLKRPGKMRFEYDPPQGLLVVSDGYNVSVADNRLKTFEKYPLGATPLALLLARHVSLDKGVVIDQVSRSADSFTITARDGRKQAEGRIRLVLSTAPLALKSWTVTDAQGQSTRIDLTELKVASGLSASLFQLKDPRILPPSRR